MENQTKMIKSHLDQGQSITAFEALQLYGCLRLASRMHDLKQSGYTFHKEMVTVGNGKRVAEYRKRTGSSSPLIGNVTAILSRIQKS